MKWITPTTPTNWPERDRAAWNKARDPLASILSKPDGCYNWGSRHWDNVATAHGYWVSWLAMTSQLDPDESLGQRCTPNRLRAYIAYLLQRLSPGAVLNLVRHLKSMLSAFDPKNTGRHLRDADRHLRRRLGNAGTKDVPPLDDFRQLGVELMETGRAGGDLRDAVNFVTFRDGLELKLIAHRSLRRLNFAELTLGPKGSLWKIEDKWWIFIAAAKAKRQKADIKPWPTALVADLEEYLAWRERYLEGRSKTDRLWISYRRHPQGPRCIAEAFSRRTKKKFGTPHRPHAIRHATGTKAKGARKAAVMLGNTEPVARQTYRHVHRADALRSFHEKLGH